MIYGGFRRGIEENWMNTLYGMNINLCIMKLSYLFDDANKACVPQAVTIGGE
jgi:hypothetical protein